MGGMEAVEVCSPRELLGREGSTLRELAGGLGECEAAGYDGQAAAHSTCQWISTCEVPFECKMKENDANICIEAG